MVGVERMKSRLSQLLTKGQDLMFGKARGEYSRMQVNFKH